MNHKLIIEAANNKWNHALNSGNIKGLAALYTENAIVSPGNGMTQVGRVAIASLFDGFIDGGNHRRADGGFAFAPGVAGCQSAHLRRTRGRVLFANRTTWQ